LGRAASPIDRNRQMPEPKPLQEAAALARLAVIGCGVSHETGFLSPSLGTSQGVSPSCRQPRLTTWAICRMSALHPTSGIARREKRLLNLEHVHGETIGVNLTIEIGPKAIHLIALDTFNGHQWPSRTQPNQIATPERRSALTALRV
jgi:hypothetical protein